MKKAELYRDDSVSFYDLPKPETDEETKEYVKRFDKEFGKDFELPDELDPETDYRGIRLNNYPTHETLVMERIYIAEKIYDDFKKASEIDDFKEVLRIKWDFSNLEEDRKFDLNDFNKNYRRR